MGTRVGQSRGTRTADPHFLFLQSPPLPALSLTPRNLSSTDLRMVLSKHSQNHEPRMPSCRLRPAGPPPSPDPAGELVEAQPI